MVGVEVVARCFHSGRDPCVGQPCALFFCVLIAELKWLSKQKGDHISDSAMLVGLYKNDKQIKMERTIANYSVERLEVN